MFPKRYLGEEYEFEQFNSPVEEKISIKDGRELISVAKQHLKEKVLDNPNKAKSSGIVSKAIPDSKVNTRYMTDWMRKEHSVKIPVRGNQKALKQIAKKPMMRAMQKVSHVVTPVIVKGIKAASSVASALCSYDCSNQIGLHPVDEMLIDYALNDDIFTIEGTTSINRYKHPYPSPEKDKGLIGTAKSVVKYAHNNPIKFGATVSGARGAYRGAKFGLAMRNPRLGLYMAGIGAATGAVNGAIKGTIYRGAKATLKSGAKKLLKKISND